MSSSNECKHRRQIVCLSDANVNHVFETIDSNCGSATLVIGCSDCLSPGATTFGVSVSNAGGRTYRAIVDVSNPSQFGMLLNVPGIPYFASSQPHCVEISQASLAGTHGLQRVQPQNQRITICRRKAKPCRRKGLVGDLLLKQNYFELHPDDEKRCLRAIRKTFKPIIVESNIKVEPNEIPFVDENICIEQ